MKVAARFMLDLPDARPGPTAGAGGAVQRAAGAAGVVPIIPQLPYVEPERI